MLATDTGITAALGFVRATRFAPLLPQTLLIWLRGSSDYFFPDEFVHGRIPADCGEIRIEAILAVSHPERVPHARAILRQVLSHGELVQAFIAGRWGCEPVLPDDLAVAGVSVTKDSLESFFNMPKKSA